MAGEARATSGRAPTRLPDFVDAIDAVLPQTQCRQCGFDGCRPYAAAIAAGTAGIDRCPPGGDDGVVKLATVTGRPRVPLDPSCGVPKPLALAVIDEAICIGCTLCIQACPVDAIVGGAKRLHDVVADLCTGCELCVAPCPVDCIRMEPAGQPWSAVQAAGARTRHAARARRLERIGREDGARLQAGTRADRQDAGSQAARPERSIDGRPDEAVARAPLDAASARRKAIVDAAVARAALRRSARPAGPATAQDVPG